MSITTNSVWRTAAAHKEDDFDAIWLYENAREWTFSEENGVVTLHYLSTQVMPERKGASKVSETTPKPQPTEDQACPEKLPTKLDHQRGKMRVLADDISYLIMRIEHGSLASIAEHYEVQQEIHELQHILADWDSYIGMEIAKYAAQLAIDGWISQVSMRVGRGKHNE